ncbi:MAG: DoxX family protein [Ferruginibacter sp.]|nr:DoxX family protein [Ferruginibacter sp.]
MITSNNKKQIIVGWILSGIVILFMLFDATIKFLKPAEVIQATVNELGYAEHHILIHGVLALTATLLFAIPKTSILGAILLTGHFGGAIASNLRVDNPIFSHTLFPVYLGLLAWCGLWLRNIKLRQLFPFVLPAKNL